MLRRRAMSALAIAVLSASCTDDAWDPVPDQVVDLSPVITEDLPARIMGPALSATRPYPVEYEFQHFVRDAPPYAVTNSIFHLLAHGGPHVDAGIHIFPDGGTVTDYSVDQFVGPLRLMDVRHLPATEPIPWRTSSPWLWNPATFPSSSEVTNLQQPTPYSRSIIICRSPPQNIWPGCRSWLSEPTGGALMHAGPDSGRWCIKPSCQEGFP